MSTELEEITEKRKAVSPQYGSADQQYVYQQPYAQPQYQQPPYMQQPVYPPPYYQVPPQPPKKKSNKWLSVAVCILGLLLLSALAGIGGMAAGSTTHEATTPPATAQPVQPTNPTPQPTKPKPVVVQPKLLDDINVFEKAYGKPIYTQEMPGKTYYDKGYLFIHNNKPISVLTLGSKVTAVGIKEADGTLDDLKPYLPEGVGEPVDLGDGMTGYMLQDGAIGLMTTNGMHMMVYMTYDQIQSQGQ